MTSKQVLYHESDRPMSLGCLGCSELELCGGLQTSHAAFDCKDHCECLDASACNYVCPKNPIVFVNRRVELSGYELGSIQRVVAPPTSALPSYVPVIYNKSKRVRAVDSSVIAIPLKYLLSRKTGKLFAQTRIEAAERFGFDPNATIVIDGVSEDRVLESFWEMALEQQVVTALAQLSPALVTTPNFSLFADVPRWDNFHNMKRIALAWYEMASSGLPAALHLNARTDRDWDRWIEFLVDHEEIDTIAFEFATGAAISHRAHWYVKKLREVAAAVPQDLRLVIRGGFPYLRALGKRFRSVTFIDTSSFVKMTKRQAASIAPSGRLKWHRVDEPLDDLLDHNVRIVGSAVKARLA